MDKAGCILLDKSRKKVALVFRDVYKDFSFPKGHVENGETLKECAVRETEEETGRVNHIIFDQSFVMKYKNREGDVSVYFYIAQDDGKTERLIAEKDKEHLVWKDFDDVVSALTYPSTRKLWKEVLKFLKKQDIC